MKNKGFTLAELLGVIVILAVIALVTIPAVTRILGENKEKLYNAQISSIEDALKSYASDNIYNLPTSNGQTLIMTLYQLSSKNYLPKYVENPKTNKSFPIDMYVIITKTANGYDYSVDVSKGSSIGEITEEQSKTLPIFTLNIPDYENINTSNISWKDTTATSYDKSINYGSDITISPYGGTTKKYILTLNVEPKNVKLIYNYGD